MNDFLDYDRLEAMSADKFQQTHPYPWLNPVGLIEDAGYDRLVETLPTVEQMTPVFGVKRSHGQQPHDRYALEYRDDLPIAPEWHAFVSELKSDRYQRFIQRMFGCRRLQTVFHWHYAPRGASVSPHCDATRKLGSHIFYFNAPDTWDPAWGGDTIILDDGGRFERRSAPDFADFNARYAAESQGNASLLFQRKEGSWHGVREITCPEGYYRKVFIVVINDPLRAGLHRVLATVKRKVLQKS
ncbi:MAG: hypothetical protein PF501_07325 [Salinisphaera sp.]|jgi:hypothetical protein|nr:hypothetical protein [Salinisphaera sp.]